ncbi:Protein of unknown function [Tenacibaculum litopenaei]|uniref:hypothetical protein n=1 Tax=Tenacibaculum litopenaei TaxID=396016 RepID=UPI0038943D33
MSNYSLEQKEVNRKIQFIPQPFRSVQCGQTCLAMIVGKTVEEVCNSLGRIYYTNLNPDLKSFLQDNGYRTLMATGPFEISEVPSHSIMRMEKPDTSGHFVIKIDEKKVFDPAVGVVSEYLNHYKISHYLSFWKD